MVHFGVMLPASGPPVDHDWRHMETRTRSSTPHHRRRARKSTGVRQGPLGGQWKLFERMTPALFWITLLFSFVSLGCAILLWRDTALQVSLIAMAVSFVALAVSVKTYVVAAGGQTK